MTYTGRVPRPSPASTAAATRFCLACDYPLDGLAERRCPECGEPFDPDNPATFRPFSQAFHRHSQGSLRLLLVASSVVVLLLLITRLAPGVFGGSPAQWPTYAVIVIALLIGLEVRAFQRHASRGTQLLEKMEWDALIRHREQSLRSRRPLMLLVRHISARGAFEIEFATDLYHIGQLDRALELATKALRVRGKPQIVAAALDLRAKILLSLGRYDEAKAELETLARHANRSVPAQTMMALIEIQEGKLREAAARLHRLLDEEAPHPDMNSARLYLSSAHFYLEDFDEALKVLDHPFIDVFGYFDPKIAKTLLRTQQGAGRLEWVRLRYAKTVVPARLHAAARVHLHRKDAAKAVAAVDEVAAMLGDGPAHPWTKHDQHGFRALCFAEAGAVEEAMTALHAMWAISNGAPAPTLAVSAREFAGSVARRLRQYDEAMRMFEEGLKLCIHPIQKHLFAYWLALSAEEAGKADLAAANYDRVVADGIDTWMRSAAMKKTASMRGMPASDSPPS